MEKEYEKMSLPELKALAKEKGLTGISAKKKQELADMLRQQEQEEQKSAREKTGERPRMNPAERQTAQSVEKAAERATDRAPERKAERPAERTAERAAERNMRAPERTGAPGEERTPAYREGMNRNAGLERGRMERRDAGRVDGRGENHSDNRQGMKYPRQTQTYSSAPAQQAAANAPSPQAVNNTMLPEEIEQLDSGETKEGILEVMPEGFGFIRCDNFLPGANDVYVAPPQIRRMNLKTGDIIVGNTKVRNQNEKFSALLYVKSVNGMSVEEAQKRPRFEDLTPIFPNKRIHLETPGCKPAMRMVDLVSPIGKGQRGMIVAQPKAGKTTLLKQIAKAVNTNHPDMHMIILLIDERPEEVTDMKESIQGSNVEVIYSTFDELPENHKRVSEMVIERAKRLVEHGKDVIILLDSITRLARAYNLTVQSSGRTLSGGLDPAALHMPKKFFGAARNMREGGSLTILATALVETGSRMDDVVFEEFKGTGNMELVLDRNLSERRVFPAIDLPRSSTRREDLLLNPAEAEASILMRRAFNGMKSDEAVERIIQMFATTKSNREFIEVIKKTKLAY